jgi:transcription elongation GreA/GreB family factor
MSNSNYYVSRKGLISLSKQRDQLRESLYQSTKEMGESVKRDNDLRENPEFLQLQNKISYELPNKITQVSRILASCILIEETEAIRSGNYDEVQPGMYVEVEDEQGNSRCFSILGYEEGNPAEGIVSYLTPVAAALMYKSLGDEVELLSDGKHQKYEITAITRSPHLG